MNPTTVRVSDTLMLSDLVGCDSAYRYGYANPVNWGRRSDHFKEAKKLGALLDDLHEEHGPFSVSYGYIHPDLSRKIVKYQDPNKPSYHRWDKGAAADVCFHDFEGAPVHLAHEIDDHHDYSRLITYSESQWLCIATQACHRTQHKALYENRYVGTKKPEYVRYADSEARRAIQKQTHALTHDWRGNGHPTYHGGGRRQYHHIRTGHYTVLSDFLYDAASVDRGVKNHPPLEGNKRYNEFDLALAKVASVIDQITHEFQSRFSIVRAYRHGQWPYTEVIPCSFINPNDVADYLSSIDIDARVRLTASGTTRIIFYV
jgi:hypothetical protein